MISKRKIVEIDLDIAERYLSELKEELCELALKLAWAQDEVTTRRRELEALGEEDEPIIG